ncbi:PAS domain S-box protein [uncultured Sphingomonas sp.]|uniref:PAS domain-containing hybrid sensor histidine kinase/response regulator n=1 Tax=uncultured Sphingomonas sp. TaxID=158754 RepID=UPI002608FF76|nr:PAS domain S-box protein [uncultured Sphingomonas sp.]
MTREELEAEVERLRAALAEAGIDAQRVSERQAERDHQLIGDLTASRRQTIEANQRTFDARNQADDAAREHRRQMAGAAADLAATQNLVAELRASQIALATSEARQRAIFDNAADIAMIVTDPTGTITDWNVGAENVLGWSAGEMRGHDAERFFTPEDRANDRIEHEMAGALKDGRAADERWHLRKGGERFWASGEMLPLFDDDDRHLGFVKILRDRTREHLDGAALRLAQERFETIIETIDAAFAIVEVKFDADDRPINYRFVEANAQFEAQSGVNLRGKWVTEFAPDLEQFWFETYGHVAKTGEPTNFESYAEAFSRWFDVRAVRVGDPADRQIAILFNDVTARREAEEQLRVSEALARANVERVQLALEAGAIIGTWHWDIPTDRFTIDDAFARTFGLDPALGREGIPLAQIVETVHPDDQAALAEAIDEAIRRGGRYAHQYRVRRTDGRYYWIEANGRVDHDLDGTPRSFPGVLIDIEARRTVEAERDRAITELRTLNETLEQRVADRTAELMTAEERLRQSQKMEAIGQLTGGVAHDFNNLLTVIRGSVDLLRRENVAPEKRQRYLDAIGDTADRATKLTGQLLAFARRQTLEPEVFDVGQRLDAVADMLDSITGSRVLVRYEMPDAVCRVRADVSQFETALVNLAVNARDAMGSEGTVTIRLRCDARMPSIRGHGPGTGAFVAVSLSDTGVGISADDLERIFEPFFTTKDVGKGTGLGLSQVFGFAKQSGGDVDVESVVGCGSTFTLYLPQAEDTAAREPRASERAENIDGEGRCVLVVEDNISVGQFATQLLEDLGYQTAWVTSAEEALERLGSDGDGFDIVFSDVVMPGMGGIELAKRLANDLPTMPVVLASGYSHVLAQEGAEGLELLRKPYSASQLSAALQRRIAWAAERRE